MASFDTLTERTRIVADRIGAFGYLNSYRDETSGEVRYEVRFQQKPPSRLWDDRRIGHSQRFVTLVHVARYLDVVDEAIDANHVAIESGRTDALDPILAAGLGFRGSE